MECRYLQKKIIYYFSLAMIEYVYYSYNTVDPGCFNNGPEFTKIRLKILFCFHTIDITRKWCILE